MIPTERQRFVEACRARLQQALAPRGTTTPAENGWHPYLSTHPATAARLQRFEAVDASR